MRIRTGYSFHTAVGHLEDVIQQIKNIGWKHAPISDRCSTFAFNRWTKLARENDLTPIYGVELGVSERLNMPLKWWSFFATKDLSSLHDLIYLATSNQTKIPSLTYEQALSFDGVIVADGYFELINVPENFYLALGPYTNKRMINNNDFKFIASSNNMFTTINDKEFYRIALGKRAFITTYPQHILDDEEFKKELSYLDNSFLIQSIHNRNNAFNLCNAQMKKAELLIPEKSLTLREMCEIGAEKIGIDLEDNVYLIRLNKELSLIKEKNFEDYFYIIADMVQFAKQHMIIGPARGSSCGSLVCYLLGITAIDPIKYDLIFERFIDTTRSDLPDIDLDFSDKKRHLVFEYIEQKYGKKHMARLGSVNMFMSRSSLNIVGKALQIPNWRIEKVLDNTITREPGDIKASNTLNDTFNEVKEGKDLISDYPEVSIAGRIQGHPNNASQHAAGVVLTQKPVSEYVAINVKTNSVMCDKKDAEDLNLLKIDMLGLTQLSIFERCLELIGKKPVNGWLETLPLNDPKAFDILNKGYFSGIFQFAGIASKNLTRQITVEHLEDLIAITALARPAAVGANSWINRRNGREQVTYPHESFEPYLKNTLGVVTYQEQIMQIAREIGNLPWEDVTAIRKATALKMGDEAFNRYGDKWKKGARKNGVPKNYLDKLWSDLCSFGAYSFNRSHAVAYATISYWCCWLKAYYPIEFAAATLDAESDSGKQIALLRELKNEGINYTPIDINLSTDKWEVSENKLIGPLGLIKGIGPVTIKEIIGSRQSKKELKPSVKKKLERAETDIDTLFPIKDKVNKLYPDLSIINIITNPTDIINIQPGIKGDVLVFAITERVYSQDENEPQRVEKRGYKFNDPTIALNMFIRDDTDEIFCKIDRLKFRTIGQWVLDQAKPGKSIYAIKGDVPKNFRMINVKRIRYIGEIND